MQMLNTAINAVSSLMQGDTANSDAKEEQSSTMEAEDPHIYFVIDTTGSMSSYISSLNQVLEQIFRMIRILFGGKVRLHIIGYKDYCDSEIIAECHENDKIQQWVSSNLRASGGGDAPEAAKTALNVLYEYIQTQDAAKGRRSLVLVYTDAPPHHPRTGSSNIGKEKEAIALSYEKPGFDWVDICKAFAAMELPFYTFLATNISRDTRLFWQMLGEVVLMPNTSSDNITKATIGVINQLMDAADENFIDKYADAFKLSRYAEQCDLQQLKDEMHCDGRLPDNGSVKGQCVLESTDFMRLRPLHFLSSVLKKLPTKLLKDESFRDLVFAEFKPIFTHENVLCLSYNSVFGSIWRMLCRFREDERLKILRDTFSLLITQLDDRKRAEMQEWIDESYDDTEEINTLIRQHLAHQRALAAPEQKADDGGDGGDGEGAAFIEYMSLDAIDAMDPELLPTKKELLTIANSLYGDIIHKVQQILTHLIVFRQPKDEPAPFDKSIGSEGSYKALPASLDDQALFALLSHLVIPGTKFTLRPTLIMAMIAYLSGNAVLAERAEALLLRHKGSWITLDKLETFPEFLSVPFVKLVTRCNRAMDGRLLSDAECAFYARLFKIYRVRMARPKPFELSVGFTPKLAEVRADCKRKCAKCGYLRSFTLMTPSGVCGKCLAPPSERHLVRDMQDPEDVKDVQRQSHLTQCFACQAIYAVVDVDALNVRPKCHYCRNGQKVPAISCRVCLNRFVLPDPNFFGADAQAAEWTCPCCTLSADKATSPVSVDFEALCRTFPAILPTLFDVKCTDDAVLKDLFSGMSLFKLYMKHTEALFPSDETKASDDESSAGPSTEQRVARVVDALSQSDAPARFKGKLVHDLAALMSSVATAVSSGKLSAVCCLCFEPKALVALDSACGACRNLMCFECLRTWYAQLKPGRVVLPSHLLCPFCKRRPQRKTLKKYNKEVCAITRCRVALSTKWYHAWCVDCYRIKPAVERECLRETLPTLNAFKCEQCTEAALAKQSEDAEFVAKNFKKCPSCEMATVKVSGCNHITCRCGAHWCYECGEQFEEDEIYDHMDEAHGGIGIE